jgi:high-affinity iron transporter
LRRNSLIAVVAAAAAVGLAALASTGTASADGGHFQKARSEIQEARTMLDEVVRLVKAEDREQAYDAARSAYLDHYEVAEIPLRLRDPNLVLDVEFAFAKLRNGIRDGDSVSQVTSTVATVREGLDSSERAVADPGFAAPALAFGFSFSILFREGVEAVLLIAILLGSLQAGRASNFRRPLAAGIGAAVVATAITWVIATLVIDLAPVNRELLEASTALFAVLVLFIVSFWLVARLEQRRRMEFMRARVAAALTAGSALAFASLGFTAVYREGFETVLFYQALALYADGLGLWVVLGALTAVLALAAVGYVTIGLGKRVPIKPMLIGGASVLLLLSVAFVGNAVRSLQEGDVINVTPISSGWARLPIFLAELTGIHPTQEGIFAQAALLTVYVVGVLWIGLRWAMRQRRAVRAELEAEA